MGVSMADYGQLKISLVESGSERPVPGASVEISSTGEPDQILERLMTDSSGQTETVELEAPPVEYSLEPSEEQPYSEYNLRINAPGYEPLTVSGAQIFSGQLALQNQGMLRLAQAQGEYRILAIGPHTLYGEYPPKIAENEIKDIQATGEVVLSRVVVPEFVVVHDGPPGDATATNHYVQYRDYIKNVASCEIYSTWPEATLRANILAIMSFTLNRVYTEWYRNRGYDFTITSSTAYDHKWIYGRNLFDSISRIVDELFENYLSRPDVRQPILTQYCDGRMSQCLGRGWMTQWGSKELGDQGFSAIEILRYFYGNDMYINVAEEISGIPASWPGYNLDTGSVGPKVRQIQEQLNVIAEAYPALPSIAADGIYGEKTKEAVRKFQSVFGLPSTGIVDYPTWYEIQEIYVAVSRIAELN